MKKIFIFILSTLFLIIVFVSTIIIIDKLEDVVETNNKILEETRKITNYCLE